MRKNYGRGALTASLKVWIFLFCWISPPSKNVESPCSSPDHRTHIRKMVSLLAFRQIFPKILSATYIFSYIIMAYLKNLVGSKSFNTKQCPAGLSPRIIPYYPHKPLLETPGMRENPTKRPKVYSFSPPEKYPLINLYLPLSKVLFLLHQIGILI